MTVTRGSSIRRRLLGVTLAATLIAAACGGGDDDTADEPADDDSSDTADEPADEPAADEPAADDDSGDTADEPAAAVDVTLPPDDSGPVAGGTLRYGIDAEVDGLNPTASTLAVSGLLMGNAVFDNLVAITADGEFVPYLAESFTPNDDNTQWTMQLRDGISFHDGTALDADAVVVNFEAQRKHPLVGLAVRPFFPAEGAVTVVDDLTVTFNLLEPDALFPSNLTGQLGMIASPTWIAATSEDGALNQAPVGTGPFRFDSRSEDSVTRFVRNVDYWGGEVYLDAIEFYPVPDGDTRTELLLGGELDALHTTSQSSTLALRAEADIQTIENDTGEESFAMMNSGAPPFDDIRARRALTLATPVDLYNELIGLGINRPAEQMFTPDSPYFNPDVVQEHDDPAGAAALVAEYCAERGDDENPVLGTSTCTDGRINIEYQWSGPSVDQTRIADLLTNAWEDAGFNVTFDELFQDEHVSQTAFGQYNVNTWRQFGNANPVATDRAWLMCRTVGGISLNWPRFCDEERDALILQALATADQAELVPIYQELVQKIHDDYLYVFFNHSLWTIGFTENVKGACQRTSPDGVALACSVNGRNWFNTIWME